MWQRIQSVYLLFIAAFGVLAIILPVASLINVESNLIYSIDFRGISLIPAKGEAILQNSTSLLIALPAVFAIISLVVLFSFKNRVKQIRLAVINFIFMISYYVVYAYYVWSACSALNAEFHVKIGAIFPLLAMIFNYLAIGAIGKDEKLVKSLDRLR
ncbi:MAG: hypothetical protein RIS29_22 [Bacteroidota bacterium]|jgi:hypothetical protein